MKKHIVAVVACVAAVVSMFFVPPSAAYLDYIDFRTIGCLFAILAVVQALTNVGFFARLARNIIRVFKNTRSCVMALVLVTLVGAMFMTNDMALLTFLPLSYLVLGRVEGRRKLLPWTFILQNTAANLGGMILPFGNPHNLYLFNKFNVSVADLVLTMLPTFLTALVLIILCCLFVKPQPLEVSDEAEPMKTGPLVGYLIMFALVFLAVLRVVPYQAVVVLVLAVLLITDRTALAHVDYGLLITFLGFFIFSGNLSNIPAVSDFLVAMLQKDALLTEVLSCQILSNLPTTLLMAPFTDDWATLMVATDIGGTGTPIASLASLITLKAFISYRQEDTKLFFGMFMATNFSFLIILFTVARIFLG